MKTFQYFLRNMNFFWGGPNIFVLWLGLVLSRKFWNPKPKFVVLYSTTNFISPFKILYNPSLATWTARKVKVFICRNRRISLGYLRAAAIPAANTDRVVDMLHRLQVLAGIGHDANRSPLLPGKLLLGVRTAAIAHVHRHLSGGYRTTTLPSDHRLFQQSQPHPLPS